jgi:hypothetical protein
MLNQVPFFAPVSNRIWREIGAIKGCLGLLVFIVTSEFDLTN